MRRNTKRLLLLSLIPWWGILFAGIAGYVMWSLMSYSIASVLPEADVIEATQSFAAFWFAFCVGAALFSAVRSLLDWLQLSIAARRSSESKHWTGENG